MRIVGRFGLGWSVDPVDNRLTAVAKTLQPFHLLTRRTCPLDSMPRHPSSNVLATTCPFPTIVLITFSNYVSPETDRDASQNRRLLAKWRRIVAGRQAVVHVSGAGRINVVSFYRPVNSLKTRFTYMCIYIYIYTCTCTCYKRIERI